MGNGGQALACSISKTLRLIIAVAVIVWMGSGIAVLASGAGDLAWAKRAGGNNLDEGNAVAVDPAGNIYTTGYFKSTATFGRAEPGRL